MRILLGIVSLLIAGAAFAQTPTPAPQTAQDVENRIAEVGCQAERKASAQTIVDLQKQVAQLQQQLADARKGKKP